jgi:type IV secretion system protein VirB6
MKASLTWQNIPYQAIFRIVLILVVVPLITYALTGHAYAGDAACTDDPDFDAEGMNGGGLISIIVQNIQRVLNTVSAQMYNGIIADGTFQTAVRATATLYIAILGIMFTVGMTPVTISDLTVRGVKLGIISILIGGGSWGFFSSTVVQFFNQGTDDLINQVTAIAVNGVSVDGDAPFAMLDEVLTKALSAKMIVTIMAIFTAGPYGPACGLLVIAGLGAFLRSIFKAMWVYLMSLVMKTLLFGIAPMFIACILFSRTKHLFDGWLNQVLNASLQPIMLFAFFAFFAKLIESSIDQVMGHPVCWTQMAEGMRGSRFAHYFWRFKVDSGNGPEPFTGTTGFEGFIPTDSGGIMQYVQAFLDPVVFITFILLAELATRFNDIVIEVAKDIAGATTNLSQLADSMNEWFSKTLGVDAGGKGDHGGHGGGKGGGSPSGPGLAGILGGSGSSSINSFIEQMSSSIERRDR